MRVATFTGLVYDEADPKCLCHLSTSQGKTFGFVQALDTGFDGQQQHFARYWGEYSHDDPEGSIHRILSSGGKWPQLLGGES